MIVLPWHNLATTMSGFTPPPRQNVLTSMRVQAEQAHNLIEDLQAGSETASIELMDLAGQLAARARMYNWTRVTIWASALEERLVKVANIHNLSTDDIDWLDRHVSHFDSLLDSPSGAEEEDDVEEEIDIGSLELDLDDDSLDLALESLEEAVSFERDAQETKKEPVESASIPLAVMRSADNSNPATPAKSSSAPKKASQEPANTGPASAAIPLAILKKASANAEEQGEADEKPSQPASDLPPPIPPSSIPPAIPSSPQKETAGDEDDDDGMTELQSVTESLEELSAQLAASSEAKPSVDSDDEEDEDYDEPEIETLEESDLDDNERAMLDTIGSADYDDPTADGQLGSVSASIDTSELTEAEGDTQKNPVLQGHDLMEETESEIDTHTRSVLTKLGSGEVTESEIDTQTRSVLTALSKDEKLQAELDTNERAFLAKVDIKRISAPIQTQTEIQGPHQYIVVSISEKPEDHLWLSKMLPERRFELLAARGAAEAEVLCLGNQPDLVLAAWNNGDNLAQTALERLRKNPLTSYIRAALVSEEEDLSSHLAAIRLGAMGVVSKAAKPKDIFSRVLLCVLKPSDLPEEQLGETTMSELSELLLEELRIELKGIGESVGKSEVPVSGGLGKVLRETSRQLREGVKQSLGAEFYDPSTRDIEITDEEVKALFAGKRALIIEADRLRRVELARAFGELGLEILPPQADLTKTLEAGLTWAPDVLIGGTPKEDSLTAARILKRDIALSGMLSVVVEWRSANREWPNARADVFAIKKRLRYELLRTFAPLNELQRQLDGHGDVKGRVESCGMLTLNRLIVLKRRTALLEVAEGTDQMKAWFKDGKILDATWTETDGTVTEHREAFFRLLTVDRGRFLVTTLDEEPKPAFSGAIGELLADACRWWRPLALTIDRRLPAIKRLELDRRRTGELKRQTGKLFRQVVAALAKYKTPKEIVESGIEPSVVAHVLRELVRRFVVTELPVPPPKASKPPQKKRKETP